MKAVGWISLTLAHLFGSLTHPAEWCASLKVKGYPNIYLYHNGEYVDEYLFQHETDVILQYIKEKIAFYAAAANPPTTTHPVPAEVSPELNQFPAAVIAENEKVKEQREKHVANLNPKDNDNILPAENRIFKKEKAKPNQNAASPENSAVSPKPENKVNIEQVVQQPQNIVVKPIENPSPVVIKALAVSPSISESPNAKQSPSGNADSPIAAAAAVAAAAIEESEPISKPIKGVSKHPRKEFRGFRGFVQRNLVTPLVGPECSTSLLSFQFFEHFDCTRLLISKVLGFGLVAGGAVIKMPQIFKIFMKSSAVGVSFASYALETAAYIAGLAYNVRQGNPFNTYGEHAFMAVANCIVIAMMFHYTNRHRDLQFVAALTIVFTISLFSRSIINDTVLLSFQWISILIGIVSKLPQIYSNWSNQSCGQLSAVTVGLQTVGSLARCFTTATEVKDLVIFVTYLVATALNGAVLYQIIIYWGKKRKTKALLD
ncbi:hypothetical protein HK100_003957 [Physocladia obscura]|uniref:Mannose-P-dolichol utilization defect 1 protein homolog n=1 Tax=Physocladia obscura TaxID=109957 RepID=A0AAD5SUE3_9FUNG|nr:hypothetical protein HK100_003957 [Physocladia obscura]